MRNATVHYSLMHLIIVIADISFGVPLVVDYSPCQLQWRIRVCDVRHCIQLNVLKDIVLSAVSSNKRRLLFSLTNHRQLHHVPWVLIGISSVKRL